MEYFIAFLAFAIFGGKGILYIVQGYKGINLEITYGGGKHSKAKRIDLCEKYEYRTAKIMKMLWGSGLLVIGITLSIVFFILVGKTN